VSGLKTSWSVARVGLLAVGRGSTCREAAEEAGVNVRTLYRLLNEYGRVKLTIRKRRPDAFSDADRDSVYAGILAGESDAAIARLVGKDRSSVGREIVKNGGRERYKPHKAEERACVEASRARPRWWEQNPELWVLVQTKIRADWSPEQISNWLKLEYPNGPQWQVCHESIYQAIYVQTKPALRRELASHLRTRRAIRKPHCRAVKAAGRILGKVLISERPPEVEDRAIPGHWEGDLIIGANSQSAVATLVERTTRYGLVIKIDNKTAAHVAARIARHVENLPDLLAKSLTWDQGTEMAEHVAFTIATGIPVYFCDPKSPWQRGTNENFNGLLRQYLPKGTDLNQHTQQDLNAIANRLNTRPRKTLGYQTPALHFNQLVALNP